MFLDPATFPLWKLCAGRPAMEDGYPVPEPIRAKAEDIEKAVKGRLDRYKHEGATVEYWVLPRLPLQSITGERGAWAIPDALILADYEAPEGPHSRLEVVSAASDESVTTLLLWALAGLVKHRLLHHFTEVACTAGRESVMRTPAEVEAFGAEYVSAAILALSAREAPTLETLNPGDEQCAECRAAVTCPARNPPIEAGLSLV